MFSCFSPARSPPGLTERCVSSSTSVFNPITDQSHAASIKAVVSSSGCRSLLSVSSGPCSLLSESSTSPPGIRQRNVGSSPQFFAPPGFFVGRTRNDIWRGLAALAQNFNSDRENFNSDRGSIMPLDRCAGKRTPASRPRRAGGLRSDGGAVCVSLRCQWRHCSYRASDCEARTVPPESRYTSRAPIEAVVQQVRWKYRSRRHGQSPQEADNEGDKENEKTLA